MFQGFGSSTNSPFGSSTFGKPATSVFNPPVFGSTGGSSLFGSTTQPSTGLFGSTATSAPAFGQPQTSQSTFAGTGLFGSQQNANTGTGLFGSTSTPFGANKSTFGGFGATGQQTTGLFGAQQASTNQPTQSLFGQPAQTQQTTGLFSTPGFGGAVGGGTTIKFTPVTGTDTMVKNGVSSTISTRHQCITCMKEYESKSLEELRLEDYAANRKGPQQGGIFGTTGQQPSLFGTSTAANTTGGIFGTNTDNKSLFGTSTGFGTGSSNLFGTSQAGTNLFNKPVAATPFGTAATPSTSATNFGFNTNTTNNLFGTTQTSGFFSNPTQTGSTFGTQTSGFTPFGTTQNQGGLFQQPKPAFSLGSNTNQCFSFGSTSTTNTGTGGTSAFGVKPITFSSFSNPSTTTQGFSSPFGTTNQNTSFFNSNNFKSPTSGFSFGPTSTTNTLGSTGGSLGGGNLFGQNQSKPLFNTGTNNLFGLGSTFNSGSGFNSNNSLNLGSSPFSLGGPSNSNSLMSGGFVQNSGAAANNALNQHMLALASMPFGDSPLFKNLLPNTSKSDEAVKPTSPAAQKALLSGLNYKVSPKSNSKVKVVTPNSISKASMFEGLDEDEESVGKQNKTRINPKRLFLKPKPLSDSTRFNLTDNNLNSEDNTFLSPHGHPFTRLVKKQLLTSPVVEEPVECLANERLGLANSNSHTPVRIQDQVNIKKKNLMLDRSKILDRPTSAYDIQVSEPARQTNEPSKGGEISKSNTRKPRKPNQLEKRVENNNVEGSTSSSSGDSEVEDSCVENQEVHPTGIVLRRSDYYTIPSLDTLAQLIDSEGRCIVDNFTIGRINYGNVFYPESFDVANLNLDKIVHFRHKEVVVYPDDDEKPQVGSGLNRRAQVTLDRVWPTDKSTRLPISDPARITNLDFENKLRAASARHGTRFVEYRPQTGSWVFKVDHFSKYALTESDEEDAAASTDLRKPGQVLMVKQPELQPTLGAKQILQNENGKLTFPLGERIFMEEEDEEMVEGLSHPFDIEDVDNILSPTSKLSRQLGTSAHKLQLMKASFFDQEPQGDCMMYEEHLSARKMGELMKSLEAADNACFLPPPRFSQEISPNETYQPMIIQQDAILTHPIEVDESDDGIGWRPELEQLEFEGKSLSFKDSTAGQAASRAWIGDLSLGLCPGFRVSWGPRNLLTFQSNDDQEDEIKTSLDSARSDSSVLVTFSLTSSSSAQFQESILDHLEVALKESRIETDSEGIPFAACNSGTESLLKHHQVSSQTYSSEDPMLPFYQQAWSLCIALWADLPSCEVEDNFQSLMDRRNAVSSWLERVSGSLVSQETSGSQPSPAVVFSYMTSHDIFTACKTAQSIGDKNLCMVASQAGSSAVVQGLIQRQLTEWRETLTDRLIDSFRLKVYLFVAGLTTHQTSNSVISCCQNLDWIRAFAIHLWYICLSTCSVPDALLVYDKGWMSDDAYAPAPFPPYCQDEDSSPALSLIYHLLKLFSDKSHPLEVLLNPNTHTSDPLDYRLSWLLMRVLKALGYSHLSDYNSCIISTSFAGQLESYGLWHWSIFVLLHINSPQREKLICDTIERNIVHEEDDSKEKFLREKLQIPIKWIAQAKAVKAVINKKYKEAAHNLILAEDWNYAHNIIVDHIASRAIVNEKYDVVYEMLKEIESNEHFREVYSWESGGSVILDYIRTLQLVELFKETKDLSIMDQLTPLVTQLAPRIKLLRDTLPIDRLCQSEMSERLAGLVVELKDSPVELLSVLAFSPDLSQNHWQHSASTDWAPWDNIPPNTSAPTH